jgi:23S rRNA (uracil1939-C5)-methyltransferase
VARQGKQFDNRSIEVNIDDIADNGDGLAHYRKRRVNIPFTIPGERVRARIVDDRKSHFVAEGLELLQASGDRVEPPCKHFGPCANCHWQHMNYEAQLALKTDILLTKLERFGKFDSDKLNFHLTMPSPSEWNYRTRADFYPNKEGVLGFRSNDKRRSLPIDECHIIRPELLAIYEELNLDIENLTHVRLQIGDDEDIMVILRTADEAIPELEITYPVSFNFLLKDNVPINLLGKTHIVQTLLDVPLRVTAGTHFRSNPEQHEQLLVEVMRRLPDGMPTVLDLYGGVGTFSAIVAPHASQVTYIESYPPAATDAEENLEEFDHVDIVEGAVENILPDLVDAEMEYDVAIVDPPRSGMSNVALDGLMELNIPTILYVSQEPETFAKDARAMVNQHGYELIELVPFDFEPQTYYVQFLGVFQKT